MKVDLDRKDLISLVCGQDPSYDAMNHPKISKHGDYTGGFHDKWTWRFKPEGMADEEIYEVYKICKNSWNKPVKAQLSNKQAVHWDGCIPGEMAKDLRKQLNKVVFETRGIKPV